MKHRIIGLVVAVILVFPGVLWAVTKEDFEVKTTQNLLNLCTVAPNDPMVKEAIHFCNGYLVGAYAFYDAWSGHVKGDHLVCLPDPHPSRDAAVGMFMEWIKAHPQYLGERPVETEFRFLIEKWPCKP
jgi:hypothetical protein